MKRSGLISVIAVLALIVLYAISVYNKMVGAEEHVKNAWSQVENQYQRRLDLIQNLVNTVQGAADYEKSVLTEVTEARAKATSVQVNADELTEENIAKFQKAQDNLSKALNRTMTLTVERYPEITATQGFRDLQTQLEGTENRIAVERKNYNDVAQTYNTSIRRFPASIFASLFGFDKKGYFQAAEGADKPTEVKFEF